MIPYPILMGASAAAILAAVAGKEAPPAGGPLGIYDQTSAVSDVDASTIAVARPERVVAGTLMVAFVATGASISSVTPPSGWEVVVNRKDGRSYGGCFYRYATGSEPNYYTFTCTGAAQINAVVFAIGGAALTSPINAFGTNGAPANNPTHVVPSLTTTVDGCLVLSAAIAGWSGVTYTDPGGVTRIFYQRPTGPSGGQSNALVICKEEKTTAGATGTRTYTPSEATEFTAFGIAIAPGNSPIGPAKSFLTPVVGAISTLNQNTTGTTGTINKPAGAQEGDLLVAHISLGVSATALATPSGWTLIDQGIYGSARSFLLYKVVTASEPSSYTFTWTGTTRCCAAIMQVLNANPNRPILQHSRYGGPTNSNPFIVGVGAINGDNRLVLAMVDGGWGGQSITTGPSGYTKLYDFATATAGGDGVTAAAFSRVYNSPGFVNSLSIVPVTGLNYAAFSLVINPRTE
ncbi:hypothetical protein KEU06_09675 [Pseudaminobacter sp. 19-2017]|uniref:Uncharacterized protein n=1 Tax=Pseudaminobacter soli (ex Zhang et al. 2022) TaxID=2831468 RepID=A0A942I803_9HYPH|nr:hypothetical protein [Pseudaminobacter soli]MBS3648875.1 hypothetical protein [Pseudaminobacter soli]